MFKGQDQGPSQGADKKQNSPPRSDSNLTAPISLAKITEEQKEAVAAFSLSTTDPSNPNFQMRQMRSPKELSDKAHSFVSGENNPKISPRPSEPQKKPGSSPKNPIPGNQKFPDIFSDPFSRMKNANPTNPKTSPRPSDPQKMPGSSPKNPAPGNQKFPDIFSDPFSRMKNANSSNPNISPRPSVPQNSSAQNHPKKSPKQAFLNLFVEPSTGEGRVGDPQKKSGPSPKGLANSSKNTKGSPSPKALSSDSSVGSILRGSPLNINMAAFKDYFIDNMTEFSRLAKNLWIYAQKNILEKLTGKNSDKIKQLITEIIYIIIDLEDNLLTQIEPIVNKDSETTIGLCKLAAISRCIDELFSLPENSSWEVDSLDLMEYYNRIEMIQKLAFELNQYRPVKKEVKKDLPNTFISPTVNSTVINNILKIANAPVDLPLNDILSRIPGIGTTPCCFYDFQGLPIKNNLLPQDHYECIYKTEFGYVANELLQYAEENILKKLTNNPSGKIKQLITRIIHILIDIEDKLLAQLQPMKQYSEITASLLTQALISRLVDMLFSLPKTNIWSELLDPVKYHCEIETIQKLAFELHKCRLQKKQEYIKISDIIDLFTKIAGYYPQYNLTVFNASEVLKNYLYEPDSYCTFMKRAPIEEELKYLTLIAKLSPKPNEQLGLNAVCLSIITTAEKMWAFDNPCDSFELSVAQKYESQWKFYMGAESVYKQNLAAFLCNPFMPPGVFPFVNCNSVEASSPLSLEKESPVMPINAQRQKSLTEIPREQLPPPKSEQHRFFKNVETSTDTRELQEPIWKQESFLKPTDPTGENTQTAPADNLSLTTAFIQST